MSSDIAFVVVSLFLLGIVLYQGLRHRNSKKQKESERSESDDTDRATESGE